jgi:hypothetical protein
MARYVNIFNEECAVAEVVMTSGPDPAFAGSIDAIPEPDLRCLPLTGPRTEVAILSIRDEVGSAARTRKVEGHRRWTPVVSGRRQIALRAGHAF